MAFSQAAARLELATAAYLKMEDYIAAKGDAEPRAWPQFLAKREAMRAWETARFALESVLRKHEDRTFVCPSVKGDVRVRWVVVNIDENRQSGRMVVL